MFEIEILRPDRIILLRICGILTADQALGCAAAKEAAVDALGHPRDAHSTLLDIRETRIQPQDVLAIFTDFVSATKHKSRKIAVVAGSGTARMQFRRITEREPLRGEMRLFTDPQQAQDWLRI
jgi:hypothetical protein